jgi:hypothetical protein
MENDQVETLSPWNLLDHVRLLKWLFLEPARLEAYRAQAGEEAVRRVGVWTASTLIWLPFLIVALAVLLGTAPVLEEAPPNLLSSPLTFTLGGALWFGPIVLGWALTGWLGKRDIVRRKGWRHLGMLLAGLVFALGACWVCSMANGVVVFTSQLSAASLGAMATALFLTLFIARGVAFCVAGREAAYVADSLTGGLLFLVLAKLVLSILRFGEGQQMPEGLSFTALRDTNPAVVLAATVILMVLGLLTRSVLEQPSPAGWRATLRAALPAILGLSHAALVWLCLLGGWQVLA